MSPERERDHRCKNGSLRSHWAATVPDRRPHGELGAWASESPNLADEDLYSLIAFLRSDDPWLKARDVDDRQWQPTFLAKLLMHVAFKVTPPVPKQKIAVPGEWHGRLLCLPQRRLQDRELARTR